MELSIKKIALIFVTLALSGGNALADNTLEHKEKSTIDNFPFEALEQEDLAEAIIEGGLEPTAAGGQENTAALTPVLGEQFDSDVRDQQSDLGRTGVPVTINYKEPRVVPGVTYTYTRHFSENSNRTYSGAYDVGASAR